MTYRGFSLPDLVCDDSTEHSPEAVLDPLDLSDPSPNEVTRTRFSESQRSILNVFFPNGMTGETKEHDPLVTQAAMDTLLITCQVNV